jgi:AGZA family xanthine/uracil permease-like MFS transporter
MATAAAKPPLWTAGDWNAFFGFGTNVLVNLLTLTALLRSVLEMPDELAAECTMVACQCRRHFKGVRR